MAALEEIKNKCGLDGCVLEFPMEIARKDVDDSWKMKLSISTENLSANNIRIAKYGRPSRTVSRFINSVETLGKDKEGHYMDRNCSSKNYESIVDEKNNEWGSRKENDVIPKKLEKSVQDFIEKHFKNCKSLRMHDSNIVYMLRKGKSAKVLNNKYL